MLPQVDDLLGPHTGAEKAGGLSRLRQARRLDRPDTRLPVPAPFHQGIPFAVLRVCQITQKDLVAAVVLASVIADELDHLFPAGPDLTARRIVVAELFLRSDLVFQRTPLEAVGDRGQRAAFQTFILQGQPIAVLCGLIDPCDLRHTVILQPAIHDIQIGVGMGMLAARIRKQDQVNGDRVTAEARIFAKKLGVEIIADAEWTEIKQVIDSKKIANPNVHGGLMGILLAFITSDSGYLKMVSSAIQKTNLKAPSDKEQLKLELLSAFDAAEEFIRESAYYQQKAAQCSQKALSLQKQALLKNLDYG